MAYNSYLPYYQPQSYIQPQMNMQPQLQTQQQNNGITWVQGESAAKSYPVAAGQSILLMDSENSVMYIKSTDMSGVPLPLRIFDYKERTQERVEHAEAIQTDYISRNEFDAFKDEIRAELKHSLQQTSKQNSNAIQNKKRED